MNSIYKKIEKYLHKNFPGKTLMRSRKIGMDAEVYGIDSMQILVVEEENRVFYQLITLQN